MTNVLDGMSTKVQQFALGEKDWKLRLRKLQAGVHELLQWTVVVQWLCEAVEDPGTRWMTDTGREAHGAEEIVQQRLGISFEKRL